MPTSTAVTRTRRTTPASFKFSTFTFAASGSNTILAAVTDKYLKIWMLHCTVASTVSFEFFSGTTSLTQIISGVAGQRYSWGDFPVLGSQVNTSSFIPLPCGLEGAFNVTLSGAVAISGEIWYEESTSAP